MPVVMLWGNKARKGRKGGGRREKKKEKEKDSYIRIPKSNSAMENYSGRWMSKSCPFRLLPRGPRGVGKLCLGFKSNIGLQ
jgi:hypothetical protein